MDKIVLVGVLRNKRDLDALLTKNRYRIPLAHAMRREFDYLAFYQPALFGSRGICKRGLIAIECDNEKAHSGSRQREKDKIKNAILRRHG